LKLFQSIFGIGDSRGRYPESLIDEAIERAVAATDTRLRVLPGYRKALREPAIHAIDHVIALVEAIPAPLPAGNRAFQDEPRLAALFASPQEMLDLFSRNAALADLLASTEGVGTERVTALLLAERTERTILGVDLVNDMVRSDVPQVSVSFTGHRLLDPKANEGETRRHLRRRAFDHLLTVALTRIAESGAERADLARQRDLLRRKLTALEHGGWTFEPAQSEPANLGDLLLELDAVEEQIKALGPNTKVLEAHREILAAVLGEAERHLWAEDITLYLDAMNIQREAQYPSVRRVVLPELRNSRGQRAVMLPLALAPVEVPPREDLVAAAERYLNC